MNVMEPGRQSITPVSICKFHIPNKIVCDCFFNVLIVKIADESAFLILENIKLKGYTIGDRTKGFEKHDTEVILEVCSTHSK